MLGLVVFLGADGGGEGTTPGERDCPLVEIEYVFKTDNRKRPTQSALPVGFCGPLAPPALLGGTHCWFAGHGHRSFP